ncbi:hypothetical protein D0469_06890 [Peribacillus saganii]|uniref:Helix-turn-helix domain-containing protein n=1 Tax=Peribacillus saganii TaxID=2303992 RepID=A0A372LQ30_9BACI|nr:hypothetical protein [Peribacillus saganii]RFU70319.1 hypothetical protein D0469_06890 [Peribacillus saganii]
MKSGNIETFAHYSHFNNVRLFNNALEQWLLDIHQNKLLTKSEIIALKQLSKFACKYPGVSNVKIGTLLSACFEKGKEISRSTFERMLRKAKAIGLINVINTMKNGRKGHNVYVFLPYSPVTDSLSNQSEVLKDEKIEVLKETVNPSESNNKNNNKRTIALDYEFVSDRVPQEFVSLTKYIFNDFKVIEKLWSKVSIAAYKHCYENDPTLILDIGLSSLKQLIRALKVKQVRDKYAYFYGTLIKKFQDQYFKELFILGESRQ